MTFDELEQLIDCSILMDHSTEITIRVSTMIDGEVKAVSKMMPFRIYWSSKGDLHRIELALAYAKLYGIDCPHKDNND